MLNILIKGGYCVKDLSTKKITSAPNAWFLIKNAYAWWQGCYQVKTS